MTFIPNGPFGTGGAITGTGFESHDHYSGAPV
jgi:hypothetical protein